MLTQYQEYMEIRSRLIKEGKSLTEATNTAFMNAYYPEKRDKERIDPMSYKNR